MPSNVIRCITLVRKKFVDNLLKIETFMPKIEYKVQLHQLNLMLY